MRASVCTVYLFCLAAGVSGSIFSDYCRFSQIVPARDEERPSARYGHTTVDYGTKMILFGGYDGAFSNTYMSDTWKWDFSPYADSSAPSSDVSISSSASNDDIVASAGTSFDAGKWRIVKVGSSATPPGRYGHVAAVIQSRHQMLVFGGNGGDIDLLDDLWVFGLVSELWTQVKKSSNASEPWPSPRTGASAVQVAGAVYVFGGWSSSTGAKSELWILTPTVSSWAWQLAYEAGPATVGPGPRFDHICVPVSVDFMVYGGQNGQGEYLGDLWRFDVKRRTWGIASAADPTADSPTARARAVGIPFAGGLLLWSGYSKLHGYFADVWQYANPSGTTIKRSTRVLTTLTQKIKVTTSVTTVEDTSPAWLSLSAQGEALQLNSSSEVTVQYRHGSSEEQAQLQAAAMRRDAVPAPRAYASALYLTSGGSSSAESLVNQGLVIFGGESEDAILDDLWLLQCGISRGQAVYSLVAVALIVLLAAAGLVRYRFKRYHRRRTIVKNVSSMLSHATRKERGVGDRQEHVVYDGLKAYRIAGLVKDHRTVVLGKKARQRVVTGVTASSIVSAFNFRKEDEERGEEEEAGELASRGSHGSHHSRQSRESQRSGF